MSFAETKAELLKRRDSIPSAELCLNILDFLANTPLDNLKMLTFTSFSNALGKREIDEELVAAVTALASSRFYVLDARGLFVDDDDNSFELSREDLRHLTETNELIHPQTGDDVADPASKVIPFFVPTDRVVRWHR